MKVIKKDFDGAVEQGIITNQQSSDLWRYLSELRPEQSNFQFLHVLYFFGGLLVFTSMSWFLGNAWDNGASIMAISFSFALLYLFLGNNLWHKHDLKIPGGLLICSAVALTPVFLYGFQKVSGMWPEVHYRDYHVYVKSHWILLEVGTIIAALVAMRFYKFAFIAFPLFFTLWYMSMDLAPALFGGVEYTFEHRKIVSVIFGLITIFAGYVIDRKYKDTDFAFWIYFAGVLSFWGGLTMMNSNSEVGKLIYCLINIVLIFAAVYLRRKVFLVFGAMGVICYVGHLAWDLFKDSQLFPIALIVTGILILFIGAKLQKNKEKVHSVVEGMLPTYLLKWRPEERA